MKKQNRALVAVGLVLVLATGLGIAYRMGSLPAAHPNPGSAGQTVSFLTAVDLNGAPADVQEAASKLASSRVGYAIVHPDKTYLIISTGSTSDRVTLDRAEGQPDLKTANLVDVHLKSGEKGSSLLIATTPLTNETEYQFNVDGKFAAIPTLHNPDHLPLITLDAARRFSLIAPADGQMAGAGTLHVAGFAQVFEAQFTVTVTTAKGRVLGTAPVHAAAGAPSWGSFTADIRFDTTNLPDTGFVIFDEGMTGAHVTVPIRFHPPAELG